MQAGAFYGTSILHRCRTAEAATWRFADRVPKFSAAPSVMLDDVARPARGDLPTRAFLPAREGVPLNMLILQPSRF
jgi:hypothetical protein